MDSIKQLLPKTFLPSKRVAQEIHVVLSHYNNLTAQPDTYVFNNGRTSYLMNISGTIPVMFQDNSFNIPVCLWLDESYPQTAPLCYVKPTHTMTMVRGKHIGSNGEVILPFLHEWNQDTCDLVSLLQVMCAVFGEFPPVCDQPHSGNTQASYSLQSYSQEEGLVEDPKLSLTMDDDQSFHHNNETSC